MHSQSNGSKAPSHNLLVITRLFEPLFFPRKPFFSTADRCWRFTRDASFPLFSQKLRISLFLSLTLPSDLVFPFHKSSKLSSQFFKFQILNSFFVLFIYLFILLINRCHFRLGFASSVIEFFDGCSTCKSSSRLRLPHKTPSDRR